MRFLRFQTGLIFISFIFFPILGAVWSGEKNRGGGFGGGEQDITIDFGNKEKEKDVLKDVPVWITQSTVEGVEGLQSFGYFFEFYIPKKIGGKIIIL
jgi:hypothetical protein